MDPTIFFVSFMRRYPFDMKIVKNLKRASDKTKFEVFNRQNTKQNMFYLTFSTVSEEYGAIMV